MKGLRTMLYKGFVGTVEYNEEDGCFFGGTFGTGGYLVEYQGQTEEELRKSFEETVDRIIAESRTEELFTAPPFNEEE